jgi:phosphoribosylglycinamide formyltransferase-1
MTRIAIFASGTGTNAREILSHFRNNDLINVDLIVSNNATAGVFSFANEYGIESMVINKSDFTNSTLLTDKLSALNIDLIVLAGFLWLIPGYLVSDFPNRIINIHPSLLPKYGGKGMYGNNVHQAVIDNKETESGITIHFVNEHFDEGKMFFQAKCEVLPNDTANSLAKRIHKLEHINFPKTIEQIANGI